MQDEDDDDDIEEIFNEDVCNGDQSYGRVNCVSRKRASTSDKLGAQIQKEHKPKNGKNTCKKRKEEKLVGDTEDH